MLSPPPLGLRSGFHFGFSVLGLLSSSSQEDRVVSSDLPPPLFLWLTKPTPLSQPCGAPFFLLSQKDSVSRSVLSPPRIPPPSPEHQFNLVLLSPGPAVIRVSKNRLQDPQPLFPPRSSKLLGCHVYNASVTPQSSNFQCKVTSYLRLSESG